MGSRRENGTGSSARGAVLPRLERWREASDAGDCDAAVELERTIVAALPPPDDGTGEARAAIGKVFASALAAGGEKGAHRVLNKERNRIEEAVRELDAISDEDEGNIVVPASQVPGKSPEPVLRLAGKRGAVLSAGSISIVSGAGGIAKSALLQHVALAFAMAAHERGRTLLHGGVFEAPKGGGPVLFMTFEDVSTLVRDGLSQLAHHIDEGDSGPAMEGVDRVFLKRAGRFPAVFGPTDRGESAGLYNARPGKLGGWRTMERAVEQSRARLLIIDPILSAYTGDSNGAAPVREFLEALTSFAEAHTLGILLVAHSTKAVRRGKSDLMDPGQVGGSGHWYDTVRGVLVLNRDEQDPRARVLACPKANRGPDRLMLPLRGILGREDQYLGFVPGDDRGWRYPPPPKEKEAGGTNGHGRQGNGRRSAEIAHARGVA